MKKVVEFEVLLIGVEQAEEVVFGVQGLIQMDGDVVVQAHTQALIMKVLMDTKELLL